MDLKIRQLWLYGFFKMLWCLSFQITFSIIFIINKNDNSLHTLRINQHYQDNWDNAQHWIE